MEVTEDRGNVIREEPRTTCRTRVRPAKALGLASKEVASHVAIFICHSTKAVHFDVVQDLSTKSFVQCLCRFQAHRVYVCVYVCRYDIVHLCMW